MIGQDRRRTDSLNRRPICFAPTAPSAAIGRRSIETEDFRDEGARRFWDDFSPPYFGFKPGPQDTYHWNSETFCTRRGDGIGTTARIGFRTPIRRTPKWSGYCFDLFLRFECRRPAAIERDVPSERQSRRRAAAEGDLFHASRDAERKPDIHILGHWTYPADTKKTIYVISNTKPVELFLNGKSLGSAAEPEDGYIFAFPDIAFSFGTLTAVGGSGDATCKHELTTAGPADANQADANVRTSGISGRRPGCGASLISKLLTRKAGAARRTMNGLISLRRTRRFARRVQQRQDKFDEQSVCEHRMRN